MPLKFPYGDHIDPADVNSLKVPAIPASKAASPPIQGDSLARNGRPPLVHLVNSLNEAVNQATLYRTKQVFSCVDRLRLALGVVGSSERTRWRFAFHSGPYAHAALALVNMLPTSLSSGFSANSQGKLYIYSDASESTLVGSATFTYGVHPTGSTSIGFQHMKQLMQHIDISPDTDYYGVFTDVNYGRLQSACVAELASLTENSAGGYLAQNVTGQSPVVDLYRQYQATSLYSLWRRGGAQILNWTLDDQGGGLNGPISTTSSTPTNILDGTSTSVSTATPGWTIDMSGRARLSQSGVPCVMKVFGSASDNEGNVYLVDSDGDTIATVNFPGGGPNWESASFTMPDALDKYDIHFAADSGGTLSLYAVSIYQYEE